MASAYTEGILPTLEMQGIRPTNRPIIRLPPSRRPMRRHPVGRMDGRGLGCYTALASILPLSAGQHLCLALPFKRLAQ